MIKKASYIAIAILMIVSISGNWSKKEPKDMAIGLSFLYDVNEDGDFVMTVELLDVEGSSGTGYVNKNHLVDEKGKTVAQAIRDVELKLEKPIYAIHNKARFFTERFAQNHMEDALDYFARDRRTDERPYMFVIKGDEPKHIYQSDLGLSDLVGLYVNKMASSKHESNTSTVFVNTLKYYKDYYDEGKENVMGVIEIIPNHLDTTEEVKPTEKQEDRMLKLEGLAVMKKNKLVGYLDRYECRTYNFLADKVRGSIIVVPVGEVYDTFDILCLSKKIDTSFEDGQVKIDITIKNKLYVSQQRSDYDLTKEKDIQKVEKIINEFFEQEVKNTIAKLQTEFASDVIGFGSYFHAQNPKIWQQIKGEWHDKYFANAIVNVKVENKLVLEGALRKKFGGKVDYE